MSFFASLEDSDLSLWSTIKNFAPNPFSIEYILAKNANAKLSGPPETATMKSSEMSRFFLNFL